MNVSHTHVIAALLLATVPSGLAESISERDYKALKTSHEKAVAAALEPIDRRYKEELEKLFKRATQFAELDLAREIQAELQLLGGAAAAQTVAGKPDTPAPAHSLAQKADLKKLIVNSSWLDWSFEPKGQDKDMKPHGSIVFHADGRCTFSGWFAAVPHFYTVENPDILKLYNYDPKKDRKATFQLLHVNLENKTALKDVKASTEGADLFLRYDGPVKPGK